MDKLVLTDTGGLPLKLDDILWQDGQLDALNWGVYNAIQSHLLAYGTDFLVEGCVYAAPNITAGWIMLAGELMRVDAQAGTDNYFAKVITFDARGTKTFKDATVNDTYQVNRGVLNAATGSLNITTALRMEDKIVQLIATSTQKFAAANMPLATTTAVGAVEKATQAETLAGTADKFVDATLLQNHETWETPTYETGYAGISSGNLKPLQYRKLTNGMLQIVGSFIESAAPGGLLIFTLPVGSRPADDYTVPLIDQATGTEVGQVIIATTGTFTVLQTVTPNEPTINVIIPLD